MTTEPADADQADQLPPRRCEHVWCIAPHPCLADAEDQDDEPI